MDEGNTDTEQTTNSGLDGGLDSSNNSEVSSNDTGSNTDGDTSQNTDANAETAADSNTSENINSSEEITGDDSQNASKNQETNNGSGSGIGGFGIVSLVFGIIIAALTIVSLWKMLEKLGEKGWKILIPFYNIYVILKVAFSKNDVQNTPPKEEFNFGDNNMASINNFNNVENDYGTSMEQSNRLGTAPDDMMGVDSRLNSEVGAPDNPNGLNNGPMPNGPMPNGPMMEGEQNPMGPGPMMGPNPMGPNQPEPNPIDNRPTPPNMPEGNNQPNNMGPGPMGMPRIKQNEPEPNNNPEQNFNNGPIPIQGTGPNGVTRQCPNCHAPVPQNLIVCPNCGANVGGIN